MLSVGRKQRAGTEQLLLCNADATPHALNSRRKKILRTHVRERRAAMSVLKGSGLSSAKATKRIWGK